MTQADKQYKILIEDILKNGISDEGSDVRTVWADGSPAHTVSLFGKQIEFDGSELPILTTKRVAWKTAVKEMLLFWVRQTTQEKDFNKENVSIWAEWFKDGNLGRSYAYQFESHRHHKKEIIKVDRILIDKQKYFKSFRLDVEILQHTDNHKLCGEVMTNDKYGSFKIIDYIKSDERFVIQFLDTGYTYTPKKAEVIKNNVKDPYVKVNYNGYGCTGVAENVKNLSKDEVEVLRRVWQNMLKRCYDKTDKDYHNYGGNDIFVESDWHCFEYFLRDIRELPQFFIAREQLFKGWNLDKDYYGSNAYSKNSCVWLSNSDNCSYRTDVRPFIIYKEGYSSTYLTIKEASNDLGVDRGDLSRVLSGKIKHVKGYVAEYLNDSEYLYRYELSRNQVNELLYNIKNNPQSRRLMTSFWNFADVDKKQLQECAWATNWNVSDGKLDLILIQRSVDTVLGQPFNWFQYSVLQHMIAHVSGLEVGKFIHQTGNVHVYTRHIEDIAKQIEREPFEAPQLWINPEVKNFYDFTIDDFKLIGYKHGEKIPYEVAI